MSTPTSKPHVDPQTPSSTQPSSSSPSGKAAQAHSIKEPPIRGVKAACSTAEYNTSQRQFKAFGWIIGLEEGMTISARTSKGRQIKHFECGLPREDVAKAHPTLSHHNVGWKCSADFKSFAADEKLIIDVFASEQVRTFEYSVKILSKVAEPKKVSAHDTHASRPKGTPEVTSAIPPLAALTKQKHLILFSDMGADDRRIRLSEDLEAELAKQNVDLYGMFFFPRRTTFPYFLVPRIVKPMNDPKFSFMKDLNALHMSNDVAVATETQAAMTRYRRTDLAGRFWLFKLIVREQLEEIKPDLVLMWHQFTPYHTILTEEAKRRGLPVAYAEHGVLPGSTCFELGGQMAESWVAKDPKRFTALPLNENDTSVALDYISRVRIDRINRKPPGERLPENVTNLSRGDKRRKPIVFYAGQNDPRAGLIPYSSPASKQHSPWFCSSFEALKQLSDICKINGWDLLYKPHPQVDHYDFTNNDFDYSANPHVKKIPLTVDIIDCIDASDVLVTIVSQASYMALFNEKPCVLLGRMQLSGSDCVYEITHRDQITAAIRSALKNGFTDEQRKAFVGHVARAAKYYCSRFEPELDQYFPNDLGDVARMLSSAATAAQYESYMPLRTG